MTNDKFKPVLPFIPKTETRIFLGGRPIEQVNHTEKQSFQGQNRQHYQSERVNEINPGYGPCLKYFAGECNCNFGFSLTLVDGYGNSRHQTIYPTSFEQFKDLQRDISFGWGEWSSDFGSIQSNDIFIPSFGAREELARKVDAAALGISCGLQRITVVDKYKARG